MELKEELKSIFSEEFFPATAADLCAHIMSPEVYASKAAADVIIKLENDDNFKYNSVDDILPMPISIYPVFVQQCDGIFMWMIKSDTDAVYVKAGPSIDTAIQHGCGAWGKEFMSELLKEKRITKEEFIKKFDEVHQMLKQQIYD